MENLKILFIGPGGVGKTTMRKIFFEQADPITLLKESLEPTCGVETAVYDFNKKIAVYDLAGQQMEDWLTEQPGEVFPETDLIINILDSSLHLQENVEFINRVESIKQIYCPNAFYAKFFHKIDLLSEEEISFIKNYIHEETLKTGDKSIYLTSIVNPYYFDTFKIVVQVLKKSLTKEYDASVRDMISKVSVLNQFVDQNTLMFEEIKSSSKEEDQQVKDILMDLQNQGLFIIKDNFNIIQLSQKGKDTLDSIKNKLLLKITQKEQKGPKYIKALIVSDKHGRTFLQYETEKKFFEKLIADESMNNNPDLISMFFSAIVDFGKTLNTNGFTDINIKGSDVYLDLFVYDKITALVFTQGIKNSDKIRKKIRFSMEEFIEEFDYEIERFIVENIVNKNDSIEIWLNQKFSEINSELDELYLMKKYYPKSKLKEIYLSIEKNGHSEMEKTNIRDALFEYLLTGQISHLKTIDELLK